MKKAYDLHKISGFLVIIGIILGIDVSAMAVFISTDYFNEYFHYPNPFEQGMVSGAHPMGGLIGCLLFAFLGDRISRLGCFRCFTLIWVAGCIISVLVVNIYMVAAGRLVKGIAVGSLSVVASVYLVEVYPANSKGIATALVQLTLTFAIFLMYMLCWTFNRFNNHYAFRLSWGLEVLPAIALIIATFFVPESPKWFVMKGNYTKAQSILSRLHVHIKEPYDKEALISMYGNVSKGRFRDLVKRPYIKKMLIGITIQTLVQFTGINVVMYYLVYICDMAGLEGSVKMNAASMPYLLNSLFTFIPFHFLDRVQRKKLIINGSFALAVVMSLMGFTMWIYGFDVSPINGNPALVWKLTPAGGEITIALCFIFVAVFASTLSCACWLYTNEILPSVIKTKGLSVCMGVSWLLNFAITFLSPLMMSTLKWGTFLLFGIITFLLTIVVWLNFPETLGLDEQKAKMEMDSANSLDETDKKEALDDISSESVAETKKLDSVTRERTPSMLEHQTADTYDAVDASYRSAAPPPESMDGSLQDYTKGGDSSTQKSIFFGSLAEGFTTNDETIMLALTAISSDFSDVMGKEKKKSSVITAEEGSTKRDSPQKSTGLRSSFSHSSAGTAHERDSTSSYGRNQLKDTHDQV